MKTKRTIVTDRKPITDSEILNYKKPFSSITKLVNNSQLFSGGKSILGYGITGLSVVTVAIIATYLLTTGQPKTKTDSNLSTNIVEDSTILFAQNNNGRKIDPPFGEKIKYETFRINNRKSQDIRTKNGSIIYIPANIFVDKDGNEVVKNIEIKYRDFYNPFDIYLAGIPMDYDSAGVNYSFMSAGMFQIDAQVNGNQLFMKEGKTIDISLVSEKEEIYNFYEYDTVTNQWAYLYSEEEENLKPYTQNQPSDDYSYGFKQEEKYNDTLDYTINPIMDQTKNQLIRGFVGQGKMKVKEPENYIFTATQEMYKNTEYYALDSLMLEIKSNENFKSSFYHVRWDRVDLNQKDSILTLNLRKGSSLSSFRVTPVINPNAYKKVILAYNEEKKTQEIRKQQREDRMKIQKELHEKTSRFTTMRNIQIGRLGTYNCDYPIPQPQMAKQGPIRAYDQNQQQLFTNELIICQPNANISWTYQQSNPYSQSWYYSGNQENVGWFLTNSGKLAILFPESFKNPKTDGSLAVVYDLEEGIKILNRLMN